MKIRVLAPLVLAGAVLTVEAGPGAAQQAAEDHRHACERGALLSCTVLGLMYETGAGGTLDPSRAIELYRRACEAGVSSGCTRLDLARVAPDADSARTDGTSRVGWVADADTGDPIPGAIVRVPGLGALARADAAGRVALGPLRRGRHRLVVSAGGYETLLGALPVPWETDFLVLMEPTAAVEVTGLGRIFGRITDESGIEGLADVAVELGASPARVTLSGDDGRFYLADVEPGLIELRMSRLGFEARAATVTVEAGVTIELRVRLATRPIELEPISVTIGSDYLERAGFYRRAGRGWGTRFSRRDIEATEIQLVTDLVRRAPGVTVTRHTRGADVLSRRRSITGDASPCHLRPYLDGMPMPDWDPDQLRPDDVEGLEIYQGAGVPVEYRNLVDPDGSTPCGVVLVWTRRPR